MEVMFNRCYGAFEFSEEAWQLYKERGGQCSDPYDMSRHDPVMVRIVKELGPARINTSYSSIHLATIEARFKEHYSIDEYDGREHVVIEYNSYRVEAVKAILKDEEALSSGERVTRAMAVLEERIEGSRRLPPR
jgi:hypothetical protein